MFDIAWTEMLLLAAITIIVVGPKDLPKVMRTVGNWVRSARGMAREFQVGVEQIARESELDELRKGAEKLKGYDPNEAIRRTIDSGGEIKAAMDEVSDTLSKTEEGAAQEPVSKAEAKPAKKSVKTQASKTTSKKKG